MLQANGDESVVTWTYNAADYEDQEAIDDRLDAAEQTVQRCYEGKYTRGDLTVVDFIRSPLSGEVVGKVVQCAFTRD